MSQLRRMIAAMPEKTVISDYVQDGLVLAYDGYQAPSGGVWKDLSGGGNHLTLSSTAVHNDTYHFMSFGDSNSVTAGIVPLPTTATYEVVCGCIYDTHYFFQSSSAPWPYSPNFFLGSFLFIRYNQESSTGYITAPSLIDKIKNEDVASMPNAYQYSFAKDGNVQVWYKFSDHTAYSISGPKTQTNTSIIDSSDQLKVGSNGLRLHALRIYNRYLTEDELLLNRTLDTKRFNL